MINECPELSIIIPCYNEEGNVFPTGKALAALLNGHDFRTEVLMVDDCSRDATAHEIEDLSRRDPRFRIVQKGPPNGMGSAIRVGLNNARGTWAVILNGDLSDPLEAIPSFRQKIFGDPCDLVLLNRYTKSCDHQMVRWSYRFYQFWFRLLLRLLVGMPHRDITYGYRAIRVDFARRLDLQGIGFEISPEISIKTYLAGGRIGEVAGQQTRRKVGQSKFYFRRVLKPYALILMRGALHRLGLKRLV